MEESQDFEQVQESQEQPTQDSGLITPQPDQPVPSEVERMVGDDVGPSGEPAEGTVSGVAQGFPSSEQQMAAEAQREAELDQARQEHNERTNGEQSSEQDQS